MRSPFASIGWFPSWRLVFPPGVVVSVLPFFFSFFCILFRCYRCFVLSYFSFLFYPHFAVSVFVSAGIIRGSCLRIHAKYRFLIRRDSFSLVIIPSYIINVLYRAFILTLSLSRAPLLLSPFPFSLFPFPLPVFPRSSFRPSRSLSNF